MPDRSAKSTLAGSAHATQGFSQPERCAKSAATPSAQTSAAKPAQVLKLGLSFFGSVHQCTTVDTMQSWPIALWLSMGSTNQCAMTDWTDLFLGASSLVLADSLPLYYLETNLLPYLELATGKGTRSPAAVTACTALLPSCDGDWATFIVCKMDC